MANETKINSVQNIYADASTVTLVLNLSVQVSTYTYSLKLKRNSNTILTITFSALPVGTANKSITLTSSQRTNLLNAMSDVASFNATYELTTLNNGSTVGTSSATGTVSVTSANSAPTLSAFTYADTNAGSIAITGNNQILVDHYSSVTFSNVSATAKNGATITQYIAIIGNTSKTFTSGGTLNYGTIGWWHDSSINISITVVDSRGFTAYRTVSASLLVYDQLPTLSSCKVARNASDQTKIDLSFSGRFSNIGSNTVTAKYKSKLTSASTYGAETTITLSVSGNAFTYTGTGIGSFNKDSSYDFMLTLADCVNSKSYNFTIPQASPLIAFRPAAVGVGGEPINTESLEVADGYHFHAYDNHNTMNTMPYSFSTNGGQTFSTYANAPGYARLARIKFLIAPGITSGSAMGTVRFHTESWRYEEADIVVRFMLNAITIANVGMPQFTYSQVPGGSSGDSSFFVQKVADGTFDVYAQLNNTEDKITVYTYTQELLQNYIQIIYEDGYIATSSAPAASSTVKYATAQGFNRLTVNSTLTANGKNNTMAYMPYSWACAAQDSSSGGYIRVCTIVVSMNNVRGPIIFDIQRRSEDVPHRIIVSFAQESNTDPAMGEIYYDGATSINAFVYKTATSTWDLYVGKNTAYERLTASMHLNAWMQNGITVTHTDAYLSSVPSGAVTAIALHTSVVTGISVNTGYYSYYNTNITTTSKITVTQNYVSGGQLGYFFIVQPVNGYVNIYVRNSDRTLPPDNTSLQVTIAIDNG